MLRRHTSLDSVGLAAHGRAAELSEHDPSAAAAAAGQTVLTDSDVV
jgi:hypothetical protein